MKKLILFVLTLLPLLAGAYDAKIDGIYYDFSGNEATVTYQKWYYNYISDYSGNIVIPKFVTYEGKSYRVTTIDSGAFCRCKELTSITIPNSITSIGNSAFDGCFPSY